MKTKLQLILILILGLTLFSCQNEQPNEEHPSLVTLVIKAPIGIEGSIQELKGEVINPKTKATKSLKFEGNKATIELLQGRSYTLKVAAQYAVKGGWASIEYREDFTVEKKDAYQKLCVLTFEMPKTSFVISEVFFAGTRNLKGEQYDEDKYIKITNNSAITRYADGLALVRSLWQSDDKVDGIKPNVMDTHLVAGLIMQVPGKGTEYPVKPHESIILCHSAINHIEGNPNSIDLSKANFEWMSDKGYTDSGSTDNPQVPNMQMVFLSDPYSEGLQNWAMNNNGQYTYALVDLQGMTPETIAEKYHYEYTYMMAFEGLPPTELPGDPALKIPNSWVLDAVNLGMKNENQWLPIAPELDRGYASVAPTLNDASRYGKKVIRKTLQKDSKILVDTNNSSEDFDCVEVK